MRYLYIILYTVYMTQTSKEPTTQSQPKLPVLASLLVILMVALFLFGAGSLLSAGLFLMKGITEKAGSELIRALLFFVATYLINVLTAYIYSKRWSWRGLQFVFEKPAKGKTKPSKK